MADEKTDRADLEQELESLYHKVASHNEGVESQSGDKALFSSYDDSEEENARAQKRKKTGVRSSRVGIALVLFVAVLIPVALFFWPTIYHYDAMSSGGKIYPLRIHRLTGEAAYFDGTHWLRPPVHMNVVQKGASDPGNPSERIFPPGEKRRVDWGDGVSAIGVQKKGTGKKYAIQIKAYPEERKEDAIGFAEDLGRRQTGIHMEKVRIRGRGFWYRILLGHFGSVEEASSYMKENRIVDSYPDSFVQRKTKEHLAGLSSE